MKKIKTILITGCDSGFGKDTAIDLAQKGQKVIATVKNRTSLIFFQEIAKKNNLMLETFVLDITDQSQCRQILNYDLDVLINNAGIGETGSLAEVPIERIKNNFEVNVFSTIQLTQLALKSMVEKDKGTIIFISSLAGRIPMKFMGSYCMTKFSLSCAADTLRQELSLISKNIKAVVVEPGAYQTGFNQRMLKKKYEWMDEKSYFYKIINKIKDQETRQFNLTEVKSNKSIVRQIVKAALANKPKLRYCAPWWQALGIGILRVLGK